MSGGVASPDITVFAGRFGSGKTETAINYALSLVSARDSTGPRWLSGQLQPSGLPPTGCDTAILVDLDVVTPYFRSREVAEQMHGRGVVVIAPSIIGQYLDTPAITPEILGAIQQTSRPVVIDVGGDRQGARALGQFSAAIEGRGYTMLFVVNPYRPWVDTVKGLASSISEIEASARLEVSGLVSNPNLIGETSLEQIIDGHTKIESFAQSLGYPVTFVCIERRWAQTLDPQRFARPVLVLERQFAMSWE